jgi:L-lysine 2,3-aminomutase
MSHHAHKVKHHKHRYRERSIDVSGSTCASNCSFDPRSHELTVTFIKGGQTYVLDNVSRQEAKDLRDADSFGSVLNAEILD